MPVHKRKNARGETVYFARRTVNGKERQATGGVGRSGKAEAERLDAEFAALAKKRNGTPNRITLESFIDSILETYRGSVGDSTWRTYEPRLDRIKASFGSRLITDIGKPFVHELYDSLGDLAPKTINEYRSMLNHCFEIGVERGAIHENPIRGVKSLVERHAESVWYALDPGQIRTTILNIPHDWFGDLIIGLLYTGCRLGELRYLEWGAVDLDRRIIRIEPTEDYILKTPSSRRTIPIPGQVVDIIQRNQGKALPFPGRNGRIPRTTPLNMWKSFQRRHGLKRPDGRPYRLHDLRHTYACGLAKSGVNAVAAQKLLGHTNIETTMRYYRLTDEEIIRQGRNLEYGVGEIR